MGARAAVFIDGGHLRVLARQRGPKYDPDFIEAVAHACVDREEVLLRVLYYDCAPYQGSLRLPVSGQLHRFAGSDEWLRQLAARPQFTVRLGTLKFRGFVPKKVPISSQRLSDEDFRPRFERKGVDMRLGLDIATYAVDRSVDRVVLITNDTDCLPIMKRARTAGLQVVLIELPGQTLARELRWHSDFSRPVEWPTRQD